MKTPQWTPGPWTVEDVGESRWVIRGPDGFIRAQVPFLPNARLIAAAPELYEALANLLDNPTSASKQIVAASILAKARGE